MAESIPMLSNQLKILLSMTCNNSRSLQNLHIIASGILVIHGHPWSRRLKLIGAPSTVKTGMQEPEPMKTPSAWKFQSEALDWCIEMYWLWHWLWHWLQSSEIRTFQDLRNLQETNNRIPRSFPSENCRSQKFRPICCFGKVSKGRY